MHTPGAQVLKSMNSAAKMCTQGAALISNTAINKVLTNIGAWTSIRKFSYKYQSKLKVN